jgi:hypothetical protein
MAGDWIKMRTDLYRDPKVIGIAESLWAEDGQLARHVNQMCQSNMTVTLNVLRNVTVGALVTVWGVARHQGLRSGNDLILLRVALRTLDDIAETPGFGEAMLSVGWVLETDEGLCFPRFFEEHNADPADRQKQKNRERQARYRDRNKGVTRNVTVTPRVEKSREEKSLPTEEIKTPTPLEFPELLDTPAFRETFDRWLAYKSERREEYKPTGLKQVISHMANIAKVRGLEAVMLAMQRAMGNGWKGWDQESNFGGNNGRQQPTRVGAGQRYRGE